MLDKVIKRDKACRWCAVLYYKGKVYTSDEHADLLFYIDREIDNPYDTDEDTVDLFPVDCVLGTIYRVLDEYIFELIRGSNAILDIFMNKLRLPLYSYNYDTDTYILLSSA